MRPTVLIADTDELLVAAYRAFLVVEGFQVNWVTDGVSCLKSLRQQPPEALILDADFSHSSFESEFLALAPQERRIRFERKLAAGRAIIYGPPHPANKARELVVAASKGQAFVLTRSTDSEVAKLRVPLPSA